MRIIERPSFTANYYYRPAPAKPEPRPRGRSNKLAVLVLLIVAMGLFYHYAGLPGGSDDKNKSVSAASTQPIGLSTAQADAMSAQINAVIAAHPEFDIGVAIQDLNNGKTYEYGVSNPFIAASISKILTAALFLHQVEAGKANLTDMVGGYPAKYQLQQLIEKSDNTAWEQFNALLGHQKLKIYADQIGLDNYDPDENTLSVDSISTLLGKLYMQKLLNKSNTSLLLSYMQNANETEYISAAIADDIPVYHKAGWLEDRVHDAAIINDSKHPYVLVIFTKAQNGIYDTTIGKQVFAEITGATTKAFLAD